jgi:hypothetical protein
MGSRFAGTIEPGAMPPLHRYFGSPATTFILNMVYRTRFSDIHCGMRGLTLEAFRRIDLMSQGWEYASEMIIKARQHRLRITEVPINFFKDRNGRISNVKRGGWVTPWKAGWNTVRIIGTFGAGLIMMPPGVALAVTGFAGTVLLAGGPLEIGTFGFTLHTLLLAIAMLISGASMIGISVIAGFLNDHAHASNRRWLSVFDFNPGMVVSGVLLVTGLVLDVLLVIHYIRNGFVLLPEDGAISHLGAIGLCLIMLAVLHTGFVLLLQAIKAKLGLLGPVPRS